MYALTLILAGALIGAEPHTAANPVFQQLLTEGVYDDAKLPAPSMPDGLKSAAQQTTLREIIGRHYSLERFTDKSPVAPQIINIVDIDNNDPGVQIRKVDAWFVAYGRLDAISDKDFLEGLIGGDENASDGQAEGVVLSDAELAKRGIKIAPEATDYEGYANGTYELLGKVKLTGTAHSYWSRTDDSIVAATVLDPRFTDDAEFPNRWQSIERMRDGTIQIGAAQPYQGMGEYIKITQLDDPKGAMLIEFHLIYAEPKGWFDGSNMLTAKLPAVVQNQIRAMRRELAKAQ